MSLFLFYFHIFVHSFKNIHTIHSSIASPFDEVSLHLILLYQWEKYPWGAELRFELKPTQYQLSYAEP